MLLIMEGFPRKNNEGYLYDFRRSLSRQDIALTNLGDLSMIALDGLLVLWRVLKTRFLSYANLMICSSEAVKFCATLSQRLI